jgi:3-oxoacyl-[acyl-carrier-protein] synthase II
VLTGVGLTSPNGNDLPEFRRNLLEGRSGVQRYEIRHVGETLAGICDYDSLRYQKKKEVRRGTRAGSIAVWCANEALRDAGLSLDDFDRARVGVYTGITEHGNVETENEIHEVAQYDFDLRYWSHHHNPRTVANNPAGEVTINLGLKGPAYALGGACAAGNLGLVHGVQMLQLGEIDLALAGGVSGAFRTFGVVACVGGAGARARSRAGGGRGCTGFFPRRSRGGASVFGRGRLRAAACFRYYGGTGR